RIAAVAKMQRGGRRDGHLRRRLAVLLHEPEMLEHGVSGKAAELARHPQHHRLRLRPGPLEPDLALALIGLDPVQLAEKVVVPEAAAELAVGDRLEPHMPLLADDLLDLAVLDLLQLLGRDLAFLAARARRLERLRAQQAADVVGAIRRLRSFHGSPFPDYRRPTTNVKGPPSALSSHLPFPP